jgi:hypothetical protein
MLPPEASGTPLLGPFVVTNNALAVCHTFTYLLWQTNALCRLPCYLQPLSPLQEVPDSPEAAAAALLEEEQQQRGGMFSRLLVQLFDQSSWQQDPTWHHSTAGKLRLRRCVFRSCHGC